MDNDSALSNERMTQITNWEEHLASIIEKTSKNIEELSQPSAAAAAAAAVIPSSLIDDSSNTSHASIMYQTRITSNLPPPPPPQPLQHSQPPPSLIQMNTSAARPPSHPSPQIPFEESSHASSFQHKMESHQNSAIDGIVTRPIPKHVEEDMTKRIGQTLRRSMERIIHDKFQNNQDRIEEVTEQLQSLSKDFSKILHERDALSRSLSMQDRMTRRMKVEWETQKNALQRVESMMNEEKQATKEEMDHMMQHHTNELATRLTIPQFQRAVVTLSSKTKAAVEKTASSLQNSYLSEVALLKDELQILKETHEEIRNDLQQNKVKCDSMLSTFDENHVKDIVGAALKGHIDILEARIMSNVRTHLEKKLEKKLDVCVESNIEQKWEECINFTDVDKSNSFFQNFSKIMQVVIEEDSGKCLDSLVAKKVEQALEAKRGNLDDFASIKQSILNLTQRIELAEKRSYQEFTSTRSTNESVMSQREPLCNMNKDSIERIVNERVESRVKVLQNQCEEMILQSKNNLIESIKDVEKSLDSVEKMIHTKFDLVESSTRSYIDDSFSSSDIIHSELKEHINELLTTTASLSMSMEGLLEMKKNFSGLGSKCDELSKVIDTTTNNYCNDMKSLNASFEELKELCDNTREVGKSRNSDVLKMKESTQSMQKKLDMFEKKMSSLDVTVFDTIQSMNALQLDLSKTKEMQQFGGELKIDEFARIRSELDNQVNNHSKSTTLNLSAMKEDIVRIDASMVNLNSATNTRIDYQLQEMKNELTTILKSNAKSEVIKISEFIESRQLQLNQNNEKNIKILQVETTNMGNAMNVVQSSLSVLKNEISNVKTPLNILRSDIHDMQKNCNDMIDSIRQQLKNHLNTEKSLVEPTQVSNILPLLARNEVKSEIKIDNKSPQNKFDQLEMTEKDRLSGNMTDKNCENEAITSIDAMDKLCEKGETKNLDQPLYFERDSVSGSVSTFDEEIVVQQDQEFTQFEQDGESNITITYNTDDLQSLEQASSFEENESIASECSIKTSNDYESDFE